MALECEIKKILVVGDSGCGKTCMLISYSEGKFQKEYVPTVFERSTLSYKDEVEGREIKLDIWDTAGQDDFDRIRTLSYLDTDLILVCFSLDSIESLKSIKDKWREEIEHFCKNVPRILVGLKADLRIKNDPNLITVSKALEAAKSISASSYIECSAATGDNIAEVFHRAVDVLLNRKRKKKTKECKVL
ncbi:Ras-like protein gene family, member A [Nematocida sp. AWRm80]|nr:Ras-like protein gene family, member A [Nematocida sp. AWRm80]